MVKVSNLSKETTLEKENILDKMAFIEAALYIAGRPLDLKTLASVLRIRSIRRTQDMVRELMNRYAKAGMALEILELEDGRFVLQLKPKFVQRVRRLANRPLLTPGPLKTLSFIAYRQPVPQSRVVEVRGKGAYKHIRELERVGLIDAKEMGKTKLLRTTKVFADYFNLSHVPRLQKRQLRALFKQYGNMEEVEVK